MPKNKRLDCKWSVTSIKKKRFRRKL